MGRKPGDPNHHRRGKGKGHGGPANGPGYGGPAKPARAYSSEYQAPPEAKSAGRAVAEQIRREIAAHKARILEAQLARAADPNHPQGHQAAAYLLDKLIPPKQEIEASVASHVIRAPAEPADATEWAALYAPKGDAAG